MKNLFILSLLFLCASFSAVPTGKTMCESMQMVVRAAAEKKYERLMGQAQAADEFSSKLDIAAWDGEIVYFKERDAFRFKAVYNAKSYKDALAQFDKLGVQLEKCLGVQPQKDQFEDGATLYYHLPDGLKVEVDVFAIEKDDDWWIDLKIEQVLS